MIAVPLFVPTDILYKSISRFIFEVNIGPNA